jgi:CheY-like chemotaxis protein
MPAKKRVLVVEDDRIVKSSLARLLQDSNCQIESATSGQEGLARFRQRPFDLVLTDLKLPDMDGMDMIQNMRQQDADLPFMVLTAFGDKQDALRALKMGAMDFLQKPFDIQQVLVKTRSAFQADRPDSPKASLEPVMKKPSDSQAQDDKEVLEQLIRLHGLLAPYTSIGRLTGGITHNINGILTGLMGHLELLKLKRADLGQELDGVMELARKIRDNVGELSSKFEAETQSEPVTLNLNQILKSELAFLRAELFFKHYITVRLDLQDPLPGVWAAYGDISMAIEEIIMNAIDVQRKQKHGEIRILTRSDAENVYMEIEDGGPGFSPQALTHAALPLWPGIAQNEEGVVRGGMGLHLARRWLETWGGGIAFSNNDKGGGHVTLTLPYPQRSS